MVVGLAAFGRVGPASAEKFYWADVGTGKLQRANLDGSEAAPLIEIGGLVQDVAIDIVGRKLYWCVRNANKI